ncbi:hypothetical protein Y032_0152g2850 [Ancylostoma ceylanicum]|nr:hypothetical protein Y032_0152g2850 [Ancylostoma ceylanicum]
MLSHSFLGQFWISSICLRDMFTRKYESLFQDLSKESQMGNSDDNTDDLDNSSSTHLFYVGGVGFTCYLFVI